MPHIHCYLGLRSLVWTMALTDTLIGLSYISISLSLIYLIRKIKIPFFPIFLSFATFITTCAATHFMEVVTLWSPFYWLSAGFKTVTAIASIITALFLIRIEKKVIEFSEAVKTSKQQLLEIQNQARLLMISNEELKKSEERYRLLVAGVTDYAIFSLDLNGRIQSWNDGAKKVKQYESNEIIGKDFSCFYIDELVKIGKPKLALAAALKLGHFEEEGLRVRKDGTQFWANVVITPIRSHDGTAIGFTKITKDLTAKRAVEDERDKLKLEMALKEEGLKLKNNFLGVMSHEMRTPVNGIVGITSLLQKTELSTEQKELSELILVSGKNLLAVVDDILDFSKLEKGMNQLELVDFSMTELVNESTLLLKNAAFKKGLFFDVEIHPVFSSTLRGDFGLLEQVLKNIVGNAVKFTERGGIQLKVSGLPLQDQDFSVRFEISDSGIGISEIALLNLFRPFSQIDNSTRRLHSGIGLGLSSSKLILRTMGGNIGAQPNEKSGCLFWFEVPLRLSSQVNSGLPH